MQQLCTKSNTQRVHLDGFNKSSQPYYLVLIDYLKHFEASNTCRDHV